MGWVLFSNLCICFLFYRVLIQGMHHQIKIKILCSRSSATRGIVSVHDYVKPRRYIWWISRKWLHHFRVKWNWVSSPQISTCSMFHNLQCHWTTVETTGFAQLVITLTLRIIFIGVSEYQMIWPFTLIIFQALSLLCFLWNFSYTQWWVVFAMWNMTVHQHGWSSFFGIIGTEEIEGEVCDADCRAGKN